MEGYDVITSDGHKAGQVERVDGDLLVIERGLLFKRRTALPRALADVDEGDRVVRTTVSKQLLSDAPKVDPDAVDRHAVGAFFGLAIDDTAPGTEGDGVSNPDDPSRTAEADETRLGIHTAEEERLGVQKAEAAGEGRMDNPQDSGTTKNDWYDSRNSSGQD
jgi:hypothetical protein